MAQIKNVLFGKLAVSTRFITEEQLQECLDAQKELEERGERPPRLGEMLEQKGYLTKQQIQSILETMSSMQRRRFGEIAVAFHFITLEQLETCLDIQKLLTAPQETVPLFGQALVTYRNFLKQVLAGGAYPKIGDVLVSMGYMRHHQVEAVLDEQNKRIVRCKTCDASLNISRFTIGQKIKCGQCNAVLAIVKPEGSEELDVALPPEAAPPDEPGKAAEEQEDQPLDPATALMEVERELAARRASQELHAQKQPAGRIADFQVITRLGQDATGVIFKAMQVSKNRPVALKIMNPSVMNDPAFQKKFVDDAKKVAGLDHPNIKKVYSLGKSDNRFYIAMEFVEAESVYNVLEKQGKFHFETAINIAVSIAEALQYANQQGMIHGDIRPSNILILKDGTVKLANLGLATKITENILAISRSGQMAPFYIAPECVTGDREMDGRTDIYSLGATLFHMIAGRPPFQGQSPFEVLVRLTEETIPPLKFFDPGIPDAVCRIVEKMLEAEPQDRYQSYEDLLNDLRAATIPGGADVPGGTPAPAAKAPIKTADDARREYEDRAAQTIRMRSLRRTVVVAVVLAIVAAAGFYIRGGMKDQERKETYSEVRRKYSGSKGSPDEYNVARGHFRDFISAYSGTEEAADAEQQVALLLQLEEKSKEEELASTLKAVAERIDQARFREASELLKGGTSFFWKPTDPPLAAKLAEIAVTTEKHWGATRAMCLKLAEEEKYVNSLEELDHALRQRDLVEDEPRAQELRNLIAAIRVRKEQEKAAAKEAQLKADSIALWKKEEENIRKMISKMDYVQASQALQTVRPKLHVDHVPFVDDLQKQVNWSQELKTAAVLAIREASGAWDHVPAHDKRLKVKLDSGQEGRAFTAEDSGITFMDAVSGQTQSIAWSDLEPSILYDALSRVLVKNNVARFHFALGQICLARAGTVDATMRHWLMLKVETSFRNADDGGLSKESEPFRIAVEKYFEDTKKDNLARARAAIEQKKFVEAGIILRNLSNQFTGRLDSVRKEMDELWGLAFAAQLPGGSWVDFSDGTVGTLKTSSGWTAQGGILKGNGKEETLGTAAVVSGVAFIFRFSSPEFRFTVDLGGVEVRMEPGTGEGKYDAYVKEDGKLSTRESLREAIGTLKPALWHVLELRQGGGNGNASVEIWLDGENLTPKGLALKDPLTALTATLSGKSVTATGAIDLDGVFVRVK